MNSIAAVVAISILIGALAGAGVLGLVLHFRNVERRIRSLENSRAKASQKRLTHYQQDRLETLAFKFGSYLARRDAERKTEEAHLAYIHRMIGDLLHEGPNGDSPKAGRKE